MAIKQGKQKEATPRAEAGGTGRGRKPPPPPKRWGAAGGDPDDDDDDDDDNEDSHRRRPDRPSRRKKAPPPDDNDDNDGTGNPQLDLFVKALAKAMGKTTRVPVEPPLVFKNEGHQDIGIWLVCCTDYFDANPWLWGSDVKRVRYALSKMDGPAVAPFAQTYRKNDGHNGICKRGGV